MVRTLLVIATCTGLAACTGGSPNPRQPDDTGVLGSDRRDTDGTCTAPSSPCEDATFRELFRATSFFVYAGPPLGPHTQQIDNAIDFETWWQRTESPDTMPVVDFDTETVLVSGYSINASCDVALQSMQVEECGGATRLTTTSLDTSGTCFSTCDAEGGTVVAVAVPRGNTEVCAQVDLTCGSAGR